MAGTITSPDIGKNQGPDGPIFFNSPDQETQALADALGDQRDRYLKAIGEFMIPGAMHRLAHPGRPGEASEEIGPSSQDAAINSEGSNFNGVLWAERTASNDFTWRVVEFLGEPYRRRQTELRLCANGLVIGLTQLHNHQDKPHKLEHLGQNPEATSLFTQVALGIITQADLKPVIETQRAKQREAERQITLLTQATEPKQPDPITRKSMAYEENPDGTNGKLKEFETTYTPKVQPLSAEDKVRIVQEIRDSTKLPEQHTARLIHDEIL